MEQQPIINEPTSQTSPAFLQPKSGGKRNLTISILGIIAILILAGVGLGLWQNWSLSNIQNEQSLQSQNIATSSVSNIVESENQSTSSEPDIITWNSDAFSSPVKTIDLNNHQDNNFSEGSFIVYIVGTITSGEFKGKKIALVTYQGPYRNLNTENGSIYSYGYYVSDDVGNTVAWNNSYSDLDSPLLGFTDNLKKNLDFLPIELRSSDPNFLTKTTVVKSGKAEFYIWSGFAIEDPNMKIVGFLDNHWKIGMYPKGGYALVLPFNAVIPISPKPDFAAYFAGWGEPSVQWAAGTTSIEKYYYATTDMTGCNFPLDQIQASFIKTGVTDKGSDVYEVDPQKYLENYKCLYNNKVALDKEYPGELNGSNEVSYEDFIQSHPVFFWPHPFGDIIMFHRFDVDADYGGKGKPVIYLYPQKPEMVNVKVSPIGGFTKTDPEYENGWVVDATPSGVMTNIKDGKKYPYLFWEGGKAGVVETPKQGFVIAKADIPSVLESKLSQFGLNKQERKDFMEFWIPKLSHAPYYFITFISISEIDRVSPMSISPKPNTIIRVLMDYKPLTQPISVDPLTIIKTERKGFTVVEWGGIIRD